MKDADEEPLAELTCEVESLTKKGRYYETLEQASQGWHDGTHDPWPFVNFVLSTLKAAYRELERRVGEVTAPRGSKSARVEAAIEHMDGKFSVSGLQDAAPGVSVDTIRRVLARHRDAGRLRCSGRGRSSTWEKTPQW